MELDKSKICTQCNENKTLNNYYLDRTVITKTSYRSKCKSCCSSNLKSRKSNDKNIELTKKKCNVCEIMKPIDSYFKSTRHKDGYFSFCKICHEEKKQNIGNNPKFKRTIEYMKEYNKKKYSKPENIIKYSIRKSLLTYINKENRTFEYIGCDINFFKFWIGYNFDDNMNWDNHGEYWHFDHIKPCASFDLTNKEQIYKCYHWSNFQPLFKNENLKKSDIIDNNLIEEFKLKKEIFLEDNPDKYTISNNIYKLNV